MTSPLFPPPSPSLSPLELAPLSPEPAPVLLPDLRDARDPSRTKTCIDCRLPLLLTFFYTNVSAKDGRQSRCKECDRKRRGGLTAHLQGNEDEEDDSLLASDEDDLDADVNLGRDTDRVTHRETMREMKLKGKAAASAAKVYVGVSGGPLIYGYVTSSSK